MSSYEANHTGAKEGSAALVSETKPLEERRALIDLLSDLVVHDTPLAHWIRVAELRGRLRAICGLGREATG